MTPSSENLLTQLQLNPFVLAPMAGVTDLAFRSFMKEMGCGIVVTELVSASGLKFNSSKTQQLARFKETERPVGVQLFGETPHEVAQAAQWVEAQGADFVDLNFGCPVQKVVKKGCGAAILKDLKALSEMIVHVRKAISIPLTIKVRTGWDENSRNTLEVSQIAYNEGVTWVSIHGRTRSAGYSGRADWDYISSVAAQAKLPIIGNGDIVTADGAVSMLCKTSCHGVMIGRGCLRNPFIFREALKKRRLLKLKTNNQCTRDNGDNGGNEDHDLSKVLDCLLRHLRELDNERLTTLQLKKFTVWYSTGFPQASALRKKIFQLQSLDEVIQESQAFFSQVQQSQQQRLSYEPFLMGGHG